MPKQNFTQAEIEEYKRKQQAEMREMTERIEKGVKDVFSSEKYKDYLKFTSKFTNYSVNNTLLIAMQKPNASLVAPFGKWKELERNINKGEFCIRSHSHRQNPRTGSKTSTIRSMP